MADRNQYPMMPQNFNPSSISCSRPNSRRAIPTTISGASPAPTTRACGRRCRRFRTLTVRRTGLE
ncbi:hypothetical protein FIBSPDRAFT_250662 [Athelia psychrophila]|uniref:Uncharacterized protein n=1 Tax=Athelia psychrophila TaxID=1759441 RepID=A0A165XUG3_9AGAM|nr:hypothetical protein FIBSPDRAFT_250662 [Fibularhizoctonia sp. CBS 109695]